MGVSGGSSVGFIRVLWGIVIIREGRIFCSGRDLVGLGVLV